MTGVVHIAFRESGSGSGSGYYWSQVNSWNARGYDVLPIPADGLEHPRNKRCPHCSPPLPAQTDAASSAESDQ